MTRPTLLGLRAALHETRCIECRVTWRSWVQRLLGIKRGYAPAPPYPQAYLDATAPERDRIATEIFRSGGASQ